MRKLKVLPWVALASALVAAGLLVAGSLVRRSQITDTGETRAVVVKALTELLDRKPASLDDPDFKAAFNEFGRSAYVSSAVMASRDGSASAAVAVTVTGTITVNAATGALAELGRGHATLAELGARAPAILDGLPHEEFTLDQFVLLVTKSAIEARDADHNDVFATLVRTVRNPSGEPLGAIGVRYDRSPWVSAAPALPWVVITLGFALFLGIYWLSIPVWTFLDAREHGEKAWVWAAFTLVGNVIALIAYLLARAPAANGAG